MDLNHRSTVVGFSKSAPSLLLLGAILTAGAAFAQPAEVRADEASEAGGQPPASATSSPRTVEPRQASAGDAAEETSPSGSDESTRRQGAETEEQGRRANNVFYMELLGAGVLYTANYERTFADVFSARVGFGALPLGVGTLFLVPVTVSWHGIGSLSHSMEVSAGAEVVVLSEVGSVLGLSVNSGAGAIALAGLGYRYQPFDGGFFFRGGVNALVGGGAIPWPYFGFGGTF